MKVLYGKSIAKKIEKHKLPQEIWIDFKDAFSSFAAHRNFRLFDIKKLTNKGPYVYYRMRIRGYRALFHMDNENIYVEDIGPRGDVYKP
jgi:mRNA-degrading endonuclease RelE of RelBE toxin-antitoxin system